jgi:ribosomal protein S18 acetylase RimI-like enzyme
MMLKTEVVRNYNERILQAISAINNGAFPPEWKYGEDKDYYRKTLKSDKNITILLKDNSRTAGFLLAIPHDDAARELKEDDPLMPADPARYYIETIAILPEYRGQKGVSLILETLKQELGNKGVHNISLHARVKNNFTNIIQNKVKITQLRRVAVWKYTNSEEPVDYIEAMFI